jgi:hypothetical protein
MSIFNLVSSTGKGSVFSIKRGATTFSRLTLGIITLSIIAPDITGKNVLLNVTF